MEGQESRLSPSTIDSSLWERSREPRSGRQSRCWEPEMPRSWTEPSSLRDMLRAARLGRRQSSPAGMLCTTEPLRSRETRLGRCARLPGSRRRGLGEAADTCSVSREDRPRNTSAGRLSRTQPCRERWRRETREEKAASGREPVSARLQITASPRVELGMTEKSVRSRRELTLERWQAKWSGEAATEQSEGGRAWQAASPASAPTSITRAAILTPFKLVS